MEKTYTITQLNNLIDLHVKILKNEEATYLGDDNGDKANECHIAAETLKFFKENLNIIEYRD